MTREEIRVDPKLRPLPDEAKEAAKVLSDLTGEPQSEIEGAMKTMRNRPDKA